MPADQLAFALWSTSINESDVLVLRRVGQLIELRLRGGRASLRSIVLDRRD